MNDVIKTTAQKFNEYTLTYKLFIFPFSTNSIEFICANFSFKKFRVNFYLKIAKA